MRLTPNSTLHLLRRCLLATVVTALALVSADAFDRVHIALAAGPCMVGKAPYATIQAAVDTTACRDIKVPRGTYLENVTINRDVTIRGEGQGKTVVDGGGVARQQSVFTITGGDVTLSGLTITHGYASQPGAGGGIFNLDGKLTVENCAITDNTAGGPDADEGDGGAIFSYSVAPLTISNSTIKHNTAQSRGFASGGGLALNSITLTIENSTVADNSAVGSTGQAFGGGIWIFEAEERDSQHFLIRNSVIANNVANGLSAQGGGMWCHTWASPALDLQNVVVMKNQANGNYAQGGGLFLTGSARGSTLSNAIIADNSATGSGSGRGGGVFLEAALSISNTLVINNTAKGAAFSTGGGVFILQTGHLALTRTTLRNNTPDNCSGTGTGCPQ